MEMTRQLLILYYMVFNESYIFNEFWLCCFQDKPMGAVSAFTTGNYPRQPVASLMILLFVKRLLKLLKFDVMLDDIIGV